nr:hypothetical protein [Streptomyces rimosus]
MGARSSSCHRRSSSNRQFDESEGVQIKQIQGTGRAVESTWEFWVEPLEELEAPGFMDGLVAEFIVVADGVALAIRRGAGVRA